VTTGGPSIWPTEYPAVSRATERGTRRCAPVARASVLMPMNVPPNRAAETRAAGTAAIRTGRAMPAAWITSADSSRPGRDQRRPSHAHSAADGTAASPTSTQAPLPAQPGELCSIAETRKVPATM
jgi:hypothetical protein